MQKLHVSARLSAIYDDYYAGDAETEWRRISALDKAANIVELCSQFEHESILEVGAGDGAILRRLSEIGFGRELSAVEISDSGVNAIKSADIHNLRECCRFDGYELPFERDQFDLVVLSHVVEHVEHTRHLIKEAARVGRRLFVEVPLEDVTRRPRDFVPDRVGHINFYSPRSIRWLLQTCDLSVLRQMTTTPSRITYPAGARGFLAYTVKRSLLAAAPTFATRHFSYHESLITTKRA